MSYYAVYVTGNNGDAVPIRLEDWNGDDILTIQLSALAPDAVIHIEPMHDQAGQGGRQ